MQTERAKDAVKKMQMSHTQNVWLEGFFLSVPRSTNYCLCVTIFQCKSDVWYLSSFNGLPIATRRKRESSDTTNLSSTQT
jgi:hypothetical protein